MCVCVICKSYFWLLISLLVRKCLTLFFFFLNIFVCFDLQKFLIFMGLICQLFPLWLLGMESSFLWKGTPHPQVIKISSFFPSKTFMVFFFFTHFFCFCPKPGNHLRRMALFLEAWTFPTTQRHSLAR